MKDTMATEILVAPLMTTEHRSFDGIPPFPDDVPTAPLVRLSLKKLLDGDGDESTALFQASKDLGFFYLDLRQTPQGESVLSDVDDLFRVGGSLFDLAIEEKQKYDFSEEKSYYGFGLPT
jgi:isopenicillin N synthase-like dioxygenase